MPRKWQITQHFMAKGGVLHRQRNCQVNVTNINLRHVFQLAKCRNDHQRDSTFFLLGEYANDFTYRHIPKRKHLFPDNDRSVTYFILMMLFLQSEFFVRQFVEKKKIFFQAIVLALTLTYKRFVATTLLSYFFSLRTVAYPSMKLTFRVLLSISSLFWGFNEVI